MQHALEIPTTNAIADFIVRNKFKGKVTPTVLHLIFACAEEAERLMLAMWRADRGERPVQQIEVPEVKRQSRLSGYLYCTKCCMPTLDPKSGICYECGYEGII